MLRVLPDRAHALLRYVPVRLVRLVGGTECTACGTHASSIVIIHSRGVVVSWRLVVLLARARNVFSVWSA